MEIDIKNVEIRSYFAEDIEGRDEILRNIRMILTTPLGSVPFDRQFGINWGVLDRPLPEAKGLLTVEYIEKVKKYEPRARVRELTFKKNGVDGVLIPEVVIEFESE
jgi:phage baseplate assembly protein W